MLRPKVCAASAFVLALSLVNSASAQTSSTKRAERLTQTAPAAATTPQLAHRDATALKLLDDVLKQSGVKKTGDLQDIKATGNITYFYSEPLTGTATLLERGTNQFRLEANLSDGPLVWLVSNGTGSKKAKDRSPVQIPFHNAISDGAVIFPLSKVLSVMDKVSVSIEDGGTVKHKTKDKQLKKILIKFVSESPMQGIPVSFFDMEFLVDPVDQTVSSFHSTTHPINTADLDIDHDIYYDDYRRVDGILIPFQVTEYLAGQKVWTLVSSNVAINTGLADSNFTF